MSCSVQLMGIQGLPSASGMRSFVPLERGAHQEVIIVTGSRALFSNCWPPARVFSELLFWGPLLHDPFLPSVLLII